MSAQWVAVIPVKAPWLAKTRLELASDLRTRLAAAFACDLVNAVAATPGIRAVTIVGEASTTLALPQGIRSLPDPGGGLNAALKAGAAGYGPHAMILAVVSDLPCVTPSDLAAALKAGEAALAGGSAPAAFVCDTQGIGTTAYLSPGTNFKPTFGSRSSARHRSAGAVGLTCAVPGLRRDVDCFVDLQDALRLGAGPATRAEVGRARGAAPWVSPLR